LHDIFIHPVFMQKYFYKFAHILDSMPLKSLQRMSGEKTVFPFYHIVSDNDVIHIKHLYRIRSTKEFIRDLDFLLKEYEPIDPGELIANYKKGITSPPAGFLLTFDDGLSEFYKVIAPILYKKGVPAICFLNSGFVDNHDLFYRYKVSIIKETLIKTEITGIRKKELHTFLLNNAIPYDPEFTFLYTVNYLNRQLLDGIAGILEIDFNEYLQRYSPYLTTTEIKELIKKGFLFGSHSIDHPGFSVISLEEQIFQVKESISKITGDFDLDYRLFSFPFTDYGLSL